MIRITVELFPFGSEQDKRTLGQMDIWNDGSGDKQLGNYRFSWYNGAKETARSRLHTGFVRGFARKSKNAFELLRLCLNAEERPIRCPIEYCGGAIDYNT